MDLATFQHLRTAVGVSMDGLLALSAGVIAYRGAVRGAREQVAAMRAQLDQARSQNREQKETGRRSQSSERLAAATLISAALEVLKSDLQRLRGFFDPRTSDSSFYAHEIDSQRARWILDQWTPPIWEPLFPYVGRLNHQTVQEFFFILSISQRLPREKPVTYGNLRDLLDTLEDRVKDLQACLKREAAAAQQFLGAEGIENPP
jgi:hypothetical protein